MLERLLGAGLGEAVDGILGRFFTDKDKAAEAAHAIKVALIGYDNTAMQVARDVIVSESGSEHWLTAAWRPMSMLVFVAIIANNFIVAPYLMLIFGVDVALTPKIDSIPAPLWDLLKIGIGGYVTGRSVEKVAKSLSEKKNGLGIGDHGSSSGTGSSGRSLGGR